MLRLFLCLISIPLLAGQNINQLLTAVSPVVDVQSIITGYLKCEFLLYTKPISSKTTSNVYCYFPDFTKIAQTNFGEKGNCVEIKDTVTHKILKTFVLDGQDSESYPTVRYQFKVLFLTVSPDGNYLIIGALCEQENIEWTFAGDIGDYDYCRADSKSTYTHYPIIFSCNIEQQKHICISHDLHNVGLDLQTMPLDLYYTAHGYLCIKNQQGIFIINISQWAAADSFFDSSFEQNRIARINNKNITLKLYLPGFKGNIALSQNRRYLAYSGGQLDNITIDNQPINTIKINDSIIPFSFSPHGKYLIGLQEQDKKLRVYDFTLKKWMHTFSKEIDGLALRGFMKFSSDSKYLMFRNIVFKAQFNFKST